tara:strand:- start:2230 stop:3558 length:1329 start_codon:yes stop_codon:yes gene_type:complete
MGATQVETGGVKDDAVTSVKIPDDAIGTTEIADGAVTLAKLANGTSNGLVLTSNNGSAPTFNTPTVEGTSVKSTTNSNEADTKFLKADGDGTCSWAIPTGASVVTTGADGLAPQLPNPHGGKFLKADASWEVPPYPNTVDISNNGLAPILPSTDGVNTPGGKFLKADGTWQVPDYIANTDTTYNIFTESTNGLAPGTVSGGGDQDKFLKGDATWAVPTVPDVTTTASGVVPQLPTTDATTKFLRGDKTWDVPPDTTYNLVSAASQGIAPQGLNPHGDKYLRADGTWDVPVDTNTTYSVGDGGLTQNNFTDTLKSKLDGITVSANNYSHPDHTGDVTSTGDGATVIADDKIEEKHINAGGTAGAGKVLVYDSSATGNWKWDDQSGGGGGSSTFTGLTDTPSSFTANKWLKVNAAANALEFADEPSGGGGGGSGLDPVIMGMIF